MNLSRIALSLLAAVTFSVSAARPKPQYSPTFYAPGEEVETPHTKWAKPMAGGPVKVLFLTHRNAMREIVELAQRLEMDYTVFAQETSTKFGETGEGVDSSWRLVKGNSAEELADDLRAKLERPYDLIVVGNIDWNTLPIDCRYQILKRVKTGTGLVGRIHGGKDPYISRLLQTTDFAWHTHTWSGAAKDIADYFGIGEFTYATDYTLGHESSASVRITCTKIVKGSREAARGGFMPSKLPPLEPNTEYVFSVWTRTENMRKGGASVSLYPQGGLSLPVGETWTRSKTTFKTDGKKLGIGVYLLAYQPGTVWFDDVSLVKKGTTHNLLPNAGFEYPGSSPDTLAEGVPFQALPAFSNLKDKSVFLRRSFATTVFGQGRIGLATFAVPKNQMLTPGAKGNVWDCRQDYDYYLAAAVKLMLWGARREMSLRFPDGPRMIVERAAAESAILALETPGATRLETTVRDRNRRVFATKTIKLPAGAESASVSGLFGTLPRGKFFADVRAFDAQDRVTGFGSVEVVVTADDGIATLTLDPSSIVSGAPLTGSIKLVGTPGGTLVLRAFDSNERLIARATVPVTEQTVAFSLPMPEALALCGQLEADLVAEDRLLDTATARYTITDRHPDPQNVQFVMWQSYSNDFVSAMVAEQFTRSGVDSQYGGKWTAQSGPYANQWWLPYATRFIDDKTDWYQLKRTREQDDLARSPCLTDPAYRKKVRESLLRTAHAALAVGTGDITLGDENHFVAGRWDLCFSDTCVPDFRLWAQKNYGTLDALNASWGAKFADWAQVRPKTYDACKADGNFVPWIDHRLHMESVWADIHAFSRDVIREVIPDARVGYEGSDTHIGTWRAADFWKLSRAMNLNNIYYRDFISQAWADFVEPGTLLGAGWFGGYAGNRNDVYMHYFPWRAIFKGGNSLWVWAGYGHAGAVMSFDTSLYPFFQTACDEVAELKRGAGKLLITSERCHDGVALLYSAASVHVAETIPGAPKPEDVLNSWVRILNDLGIASRIVSYEQLAKGRVKAAPNGFRALILPCAWAMSPVECAAVQAFADDGGAVLADLMPALTDEHGKAFDELPLAPLFGAKRTGAFAEKTDILHGVEGISDASVEGIGIRKDNALLLNLSLDGYARLPKPKETDFAGWVEGAAYRKLVADALAAAGVVPAVTLAPIQPRVEISRFRRGDCEYIALLQALPRDPIEYTLKTAQPPQANIVTIQFPRKAYLYDVRAGKYLGRKDRLETELTPGIAKLYALLPGKVSRMRVDAPRRARVGDSVSVKLTVVAKGAKADRVLHVEVIGPDGIARAPYARTLLANGGNAEIHIHFALSDPPGKWRVTARDAATGVADTDTIRLVQ